MAQGNFDQLSVAAIAVPLLSKAYFESGNCEHEAREIVAANDSKKLLMIPVKLYPEKLDAPAWLKDIQQERAFSFANDADALAQRLVELVKGDA